MMTSEASSVLLVDDDQDFRRYIREASRAEGREFNTASNFNVALSVIHKEQKRYMSIFVDIHLHQAERGGLQLVEYVRKVAPHRVVPYVLTGDESDETEDAALETGAYHVFYKNTPVRRLIRYTRLAYVRKLVENQTKDKLTGLLNYETFQEMVMAEMSTARDHPDPQHPESFSLLFLDLDKFKDVNDNYGHQAGDEALRRAAEVFRWHVRRGDHPCRKSGDEFLIWLPDADIRVACAIGRKLQRELALEIIAVKDLETVKLSVSFGAASINRKDIRDVFQTFKELEHHADISMYDVKPD